MLKRFIAYYKPHRKLFYMDMIASILISLIGMVYPVVTRKMLNDYIPNKIYKSIVIAGIVVLALYTLRLLLRYFVQYYGHMVGTYMQAQMRKDMFEHLEQLPFSFYDNNETGKIMSRMTNDLFEVAELAHHGPENLLTCSIMIILSFTYLCTINPFLTLIIFSCVPILVFISIHYRKKMREAQKERRANMAVINGALESSISGIRVTKAYTNSDKEMEKFEESNQEFVRSSSKMYNAMGKFFSGTSFVTDVFNVIILIAGGLFLYADKINFGDYSTFIVSVNLFISPVNTLIGFVEQYQNGVTGFERFIEIMDTPVEIETENAVEITDVKGEIRFKDVVFSYKREDKDEEVLKCVNFTLAPGKKLALVGSSGGGKTTICHLLPRFYRLGEDCGEILVDGKNINDVTMDSLRKNIGIVQQDVFLFSGTIADNIRYGKPDAAMEEIVEAGKKANLHEYVMSLPNGYDTQIGERGVKLSGGQKQRVSIARVFLKNPAILILDEATSALDNVTEMQIQKALDELCKDRTTIVVAHRLSTVKNADEIAVVVGGEIVERGTHEELMEIQDGMYKNLYSLQFKSATSSAL